MKWVSVQDKLPGVFEIVWTYWKNKEVLLGCRTHKDNRPQDCWYSFNDGKLGCVHLWMPHKDSICETPLSPEKEKLIQKEIQERLP